MQQQMIGKAGLQRPFDRFVAPICLIVICISTLAGLKIHDLYFSHLNEITIMVGGTIGFVIGTAVSVFGTFIYMSETDPITTIPSDKECY